MSVWDDMARDGGYRGEQAREIAQMLEEEERERAAAPEPEPPPFDLGPPVAGRRVDITACEWRIGEAGLEELRIVERAHPDGIRYAVKWLSYTANKNGQWEWEPIPSSRDEAYFERCRFDDWEDAYQTAIRMPLDSTGALIP